MFTRNKHYISMYSVDMSILPSDMDILPVPSPVDDEENTALFPQDPSTGQLVDLLSQVLQTENPLLRDSLLSKLQSLPPSSSALQGVDDVTKIQLLKPRSCQSLADMAQFTEFVSAALDQLNVDPNKSESLSEPDPVPDPVPQPEPQPVSNH